MGTDILPVDGPGARRAWTSGVGPEWPLAGWVGKARPVVDRAGAGTSSCSCGGS